MAPHCGGCYSRCMKEDVGHVSGVQGGSGNVKEPEQDKVEQRGKGAEQGGGLLVHARRR